MCWPPASPCVGIVFYVLIYTSWLKRSTVQNIVIGGAAGAVPPIVGWAAVSDRITLTSVLLFAIIFFWTPPHFWALSLIIKKDYERAGIPMLPVVAGDAATRRQILAYTVVLIAVTLLPVVTGAFGADLSRVGAGAWRLHALSGRPSVARRHAAVGESPVLVLELVPDAAVRHHGDRPRHPLGARLVAPGNARGGDRDHGGDDRHRAARRPRPSVALTANSPAYSRLADSRAVIAVVPFERHPVTRAGQLRIR